MACRLFDAKPLPESMLIYSHLDPYQEQTSVKFESKCKIFIDENAFEMSAKWRPFCPGEYELKAPSIYSSWRDEQIKQNMNTEYGFYEANCIYLQIVLQSSENFSHLLAYRRSLIY